MKLFVTAFLSLMVMFALSGNTAWAAKKKHHSKSSHSHSAKKSSKSASHSHKKKNRRVSSGG
jgi:hypothetical protein